LRRQFCTKRSGFSISCSYSLDKDPLIEKLTDARVIYSVAPAMGHNQVSSAELCFHIMDVLMCYGVFTTVKVSFLRHACLVLGTRYIKSGYGLCYEHVNLYNLFFILS
jgi:hypothetical protein